MTTPAIPDVVTTSTALITNVGSQLVNASVGVLPIVATVAIPLAVLGAVAAKLGLKRKSHPVV